MGLWLKCPKCQTANSLDLKSCMKCNASLENLPAAKRVYILADAAPAAPKEAAKAKAATENVDLEATSSTKPPPKRTRGPKTSKKKS
jgi:acetyl-CoA carboxylase beta subunit